VSVKKPYIFLRLTLNEYNDRDREKREMSGTRSDKDSDMAGQGQRKDRKMTGIRQDQVRERTRQEEVNRTRTMQVKVRDKIVKDLAKNI
jgi:hypothetical protein